jgi:hypothetical protein
LAVTKRVRRRRENTRFSLLLKLYRKWRFQERERRVFRRMEFLCI